MLSINHSKMFANIKFLTFCSEEPGQYECYWHFHHSGRRFGHWLGCQVIVDPFNLKGNKSVLETSFTMPFEQPLKTGSPVTNYSEVAQGNYICYLS